MKTISLNVEQGSKTIVGQLNLPDGKGPFSLMIYSHGFGYNYSLFDLSKLAAHGIASYLFDFGGGSPWSKSTGKSVDMSAVTEAQELTAVLQTLRNRPDIDSNAVFLSGNSQGGFVSTIVGTAHANLVRGLLLLSPAFIISTMADEYMKQVHLKKHFRFGNMQLSSRYYTDLRDYDPYEQMKHFSNPVTIIHGDRDSMVPISYAQKAAQYFPNAKLVIASGEGHDLTGFQPHILSEAVKLVNGTNA